MMNRIFVSFSLYSIQFRNEIVNEAVLFERTESLSFQKWLYLKRLK